MSTTHTKPEDGPPFDALSAFGGDELRVPGSIRDDFVTDNLSHSAKAVCAILESQEGESLSALVSMLRTEVSRMSTDLEKRLNQIGNHSDLWSDEIRIEELRNISGITAKVHGGVSALLVISTIIVVLNEMVFDARQVADGRK